MPATNKGLKLRNDPTTQKFQIGYSVITWEFIGRSIEDALVHLAKMGYGWFEGFIRHGLGSPLNRHYETYSDWAPRPPISDIDLLRRLAVYGRAQTKYGLRPASFFSAWTLTNPTLWEYERDMIQALAHYLRGCEAPYIDIGGGPFVLDGDHSVEEYRAFARSLEEIGEYTQTIGVRTVYHPNPSSFIEKHEQLDRLMDVLNTDLVGLCIDPAHFYISGSDPVDILRKYVNNTDIVHLKDCRSDFGDLVGFERWEEFCELGEGVIDIPEIVDILLENDFEGIAITELDFSEMTPEESSQFNTDYIKNTLGLSLD